MQGLIFIVAGLALGGLVCRLASINWFTHLGRVVGLHAALAIAAGQALVSAATGDAGVIDAAASVAGLLHLYVTWPTWAAGPPSHTESRPVPLDETCTEFPQ